MPLGAASGIFQAAQTLGSVGAPTGNLRTATAGTTTAGTDSLYSSGANISASTPNSHALSPASNHAHSTTTPSDSSSAMSNQQFETPRRSQTYGRQPPDELHLTPGTNAGNAGPRGQLSPREYASGGAPRISLEQATPDVPQYQGGGGVPTSLQSGANRPGPLAANTAPAVPTISQSGSQDPYSTPSRTTNTMNLSHNYSRSSPNAGYEGQNYIPFSTTPGGTEPPQYGTPSNLKYTPQQRNVSNTPLGLADIRPRADSTLSDNLPGANPYSYDGANAVPTNSNYLAPWAIYAFDWCKWPAQNNDAGKVAVGSYLEDGHNFVSSLLNRSLNNTLTKSVPDTNS
jgi:WD repeat-containing protein 68